MRPRSRSQREVEEGRRKLRIAQVLQAKGAAGKLIEQSLKFEALHFICLYLELIVKTPLFTRS
jgi:hypothetical protein